MNTKKAVVCDDDRTLIRIIEHVLKKQGFSVWSASDGEQGLALLRAQAPELLILDLDMPVKGGMAVLEELKQQTSRPYTIILSNYEDPEQHQKAKTLGAKEFLVKPLDPVEFLKKIEGLVKEGRI